MPTVFDAAVQPGDAIVRNQANTAYEVLPTIGASDVFCVIRHAADAGVARTPVDAGAVYWIGSVSPTNALAGDLYGNTTTGVIAMITSVSSTAGHASGTGSAHTASLSIRPNAAVASGTGSAHSATVSTATALDLDFLQSTSSETDTTTYTYSSQNLGTAASDRYIIVVGYGRRASTTSVAASSVTVGGVSATIAVQRHNTFNNSVHCFIAIAAVPSGTTGDVVVTYDQTLLRAQMALYRVTGLVSATASDTATVDADYPVGNESEVLSMSIDVPAGGFVVALSATPATTTTTWTGATEDFDVQIGSTISTVSGASQVYGSTQTGLTVASTWGSHASGSEAVGVAASWA